MASSVWRVERLAGESVMVVAEAPTPLAAVREVCGRLGVAWELGVEADVSRLVGGRWLPARRVRVDAHLTWDV